MSHDEEKSAPPTARQKRWKWAKRILTLIFFGLVLTLLYTQAKSVEWDEVGEAMTAYRPATLVLAAVLAVSSHLLFSSFDLLGRLYTSHGLSKAKVLLVASISYAFTLNLGALVGGVGFRYRLYNRLGLKNSVITRVYGLSVLTNWLGYLVLAGSSFLFMPIDLPDDWKIGSSALRVVGAVLLTVAVGYLAACAFLRRRTWTIKGHDVTLPSLRMALTQCVMSVSNWSLMAGVIYTLLGQQVAYNEVLMALLASALAGVITHVPAGLGVLETVFLALLGGQIAPSAVLAGLLAYRGIYYLVPLVLATVAYAMTELRARRTKPA